MKILFITSSRLGDAVLTTGVLAHLVETYPQSEITLACGPIAAPLFEAVPGLKQLIVLERQSFSRHWMKLWLKTVGTVWDMIVDFRGTGTSFILRTRQKRWIWSSPKTPGHQVEHVGRLLGLTPPPSPYLWTQDRHEALADQWIPKNTPILAISPAANWPCKQWPLSFWKELLTQFTQEKGLFSQGKILVCAAPHERAQVEELLGHIPSSRLIDAIGALDLLTLYACFKRCTLFIGNDSGLMHLAAASGVPTLGLFGPSRPERYGPWGEQTSYVRTPEPPETLLARLPTLESLMGTLLPEDVLREASLLLKKIEAKRQVCG